MSTGMERSDTIPIFPGIIPGTFEDIIEETSLMERLDTQDLKEIFSSPDDQKLPSPELWNYEEGFINTHRPTIYPTIEKSDIEQPGTSAAEVQFENAIYLVHPSSAFIGDADILRVENEGQIMLEENEENKFISVENMEAPTTDQTVLNAYPEENYSDPNVTSVPSLSLQPWRGSVGFTVEVETNTHTNSKWAYSKALKKLFLRPFDTVPIEVKVSTWINGYINITPVYKSSEHMSKPVNRCYNHKLLDQEKKLPFFEHIVQVDNANAKYRVDGLRHSVDVPLTIPAPGETSTRIYLKCGCWNTCTGGPDRKQFCLLFTLFTNSGNEIGRQIIDLKVCACPIRDCGYSEKRRIASKTSPGKSGRVKACTRKKPVPTSKAVKKIKCETEEQNFEQISVPSEIAKQVKRFVNQLMAEKYAKENSVYLPFPDC